MPRERRADHDLTAEQVADLLKQIETDFQITDAPGRLVLGVLSQALSRAIAARQQLERDGATTRDARGRPKAHPAAAVERDALRLALSALRELRLDVEPPRPGPGRPPGGGGGM